MIGIVITVAFGLMLVAVGVRLFLTCVRGAALKQMAGESDWIFVVASVLGLVIVAYGIGFLVPGGFSAIGEAVAKLLPRL